MKHTFKSIIALAAVAMSVSLTSCSDFLDVQSENTAKENDLLSTYKGFRDALSGAYMIMADESGYGQNTTMTHLDAMTHLWWCISSHEDEFPLLYQLSNHKYGDDAAKSAIAGIYSNMFKAIAQANVISEHCQSDGGAIENAKLRNTIHGEALAIRAYCQLDVLRLFGQMPKNGAKKVRLPYSFCTGVDKMPDYYDYDAYCKLLEKDIDDALALMKDNDPVCEYGFSTESGKTSDDDFFVHREMRLNYYAVQALKCRFLLYTGRNAEAHKLALELINAKGSDGAPVISLSGVEDLKEVSGTKKAYHGLPSECLFMLSKFDILKKANAVLFGFHKDEAEVRQDENMVMTTADWNKLYVSQGTIAASNNRYLSQWADARQQTQTYKSTLKYWYSQDYKGGTIEQALAPQNEMYKQQIIPMLRMSEIYLIAIETSTSVDDANKLYTTYMGGCGIPASVCPQFESLEDMKAEMLNEYQREFAAEGQAFYTYKRVGAKRMMFDSKEMTESEYIVPLPDTEYDPAL